MILGIMSKYKTWATKSKYIRDGVKRGFFSIIKIKRWLFFSILSIKSVIQLLGQALQQAVHQKQLRQLIVESMSFEGGFKASKDYLQPILKNAVIALPFLLVMENIKRTALLIGIVYFAMHMMSSIASPVMLTS